MLKVLVMVPKFRHHGVFCGDLEQRILCFLLFQLISIGIYTSKPARACAQAYDPLAPKTAIFDGTRLKIPFSEVPVTAESLLAAHQKGYLPERDGTWEIPSTRGVVFLENITIGKKPRRRFRKLRTEGVRITWNTATEEVIRSCKEMKRQPGNASWMTNEVLAGYTDLYRQGYVYSIELWDREGNLVAGSFGIISGGHVQGISKFRDSNHTLNKLGPGNLLDVAERQHFRSRGLKIFDDEVATVAGQFPKAGMSAMPHDQFATLLEQFNAEERTFFEGAEPGKPLPPIRESTFLGELD